MAAVGPGGGVISKQPIKTSRRRYFQNGCRVEACGPLRRNHCIDISGKNNFEVVDDKGHDSTAVSRFSSGSIF